MRIFSLIMDLFPSREAWLLGGVFAIGLISAAFQTIGVASILPFMTLVLEPETINRYPMIVNTAVWIGVSPGHQTIFFIGFVTVALIAVGNIAGALHIVVQERFTAHTTTRLSTSLVAGYLGQPYSYHVERDAPSLIKIVINDVRLVMSGVVTPWLNVVSRIFIVLGLLVLLFLQDPIAASTMTIVLGVSYALTFQLVRTKQRRNSLAMNHGNLERQRVLQEGLGGIKDLNIFGRGHYVLDRFVAATSVAANAEASNRIVGALPRFALETVAFGGILIVTLVLMANPDQTAASMIPVLALYAFAGYRLLPALQLIFTSAVTIRFYTPVLQGLHSDIAQTTKAKRPATALLGEASDSADLQIRFEQEFRMEKVTFCYPGNSTPSLRDISLCIRPRQSIGLVGRTGAGKTTLADLILALYTPTEGVISVDGMRLSDNMISAWRSRLGYVPQNVFLANATVAENIAFALPSGEIDRNAVIKAAKLAQAFDFILSLPQGFDTVVGERGVRLSGGQRQRLGIARALYGEPGVLVFDEATSALDGLTEEAVMDAIRSLSGDRTIILIAHRLRTIEACERIIMVDQGRIVADGSYKALINESADFRALARHSLTPSTKAT